MLFPSEGAPFRLYEDDGISESYKEGNYSITKVVSEPSKTGRVVRIGKAEGKFPVPQRKYILKVHQEKAPAGVTLQLNGKKKKINQLKTGDFSEAENAVWYYDVDEKLLWVKSPKGTEEALNVRIIY